LGLHFVFFAKCGLPYISELIQSFLYMPIRTAPEEQAQATGLVLQTEKNEEVRCILQFSLLSLKIFVEIENKN